MNRKQALTTSASDCKTLFTQVFYSFMAHFNVTKFWPEGVYLFHNNRLINCEDVEVKSNETDPEG